MKTLILLSLLLLLTIQSSALNVGSQLKNAQLENRTADYPAGVRGRFWLRTDLGLSRYDDGATIREFLSKDQAQIITNKDIDGGTASNTSRLTIPKAATATLNALTRKAGTVVYDTTTSEFKLDNGSVLLPLAVVPPGTISNYAGAIAPTGYLLGNGAAVSRTTFANLFAITGVTYGVGDGATTFNTPNCTRRVMVGSGGTGTATLGNTLGSTGGAETLPLHNHSTPLLSHSIGNAAHATNIHAHDAGVAAGSLYAAIDIVNGSPNIFMEGFSGAYTGTVIGMLAANSSNGVNVRSNATKVHGSTSGPDSSASTTVGDHAAGVTGDTGTGTHGVIQPSLVVNCIVKY